MTYINIIIVHYNSCFDRENNYLQSRVSKREENMKQKARQNGFEIQISMNMMINDK